MDIKIGENAGQQTKWDSTMSNFAYEVEQVQFYVYNLEKYRTRITMWFHDNNTKKF